LFDGLRNVPPIRVAPKRFASPEPANKPSPKSLGFAQSDGNKPAIYLPAGPWAKRLLAFSSLGNFRLVLRKRPALLIVRFKEGSRSRGVPLPHESVFDVIAHFSTHSPSA